MAGKLHPTTQPQQARLTDHQILSGEPKHINNDHLLQLAATHTNIKIAKLANIAHEKQVLTPEVVSNRLCRSINRIAKRDGGSRDEVKAELDAAKVANGISKHKTPTTGLRPQEGPVAEQAGEVRDDSAERELDVETLLGTIEQAYWSEESDSDDEGSTHSDDLEEQLRRAEVHGLFEGDSALMDDDVVQLATKYTITEIVEHLNAGREVALHSTRSVNERIGKAVVGLATRQGKTAKEVQEEIQESKVENGVTEREVAEKRANRRARKG